MNHYEILNISPEADFEEIKRAYLESGRKAAEAFIDGNFSGVLDDGRLISDIHSAWRTLGDAKSREGYNNISSVSAWIIANGFDAERAREACHRTAPGKSNREAKRAFAEGKEAFSADRFQDAMKALQRAIKLDPDNPLYHRNVGLAYMKLKMYELAIAAFERTLEIDPLDPKNHLSYGRALMAAGRIIEARKTLQRALVIDPEDREINNLIAEASRGWQIMARQRIPQAWFLPGLIIGVGFLVLIYLLFWR